MAKQLKYQVSGSKLGVMVTGVTAAEVRQALALLAHGGTKRGEKSQSERIRRALQYYDVNHRFFKNGGRYKIFKKGVKRRSKKAAVKKAATPAAQ